MSTATKGIKMSTKRKVYSTEFKTKLVLKVLKNEKTVNEIARENNLTPKNLQNWKKIFLENAEMALEPSKAVKEYKDEIFELKATNDTYAKVVGKMTVEKEWLEKKPQSLGLSEKKAMIEPELETISIVNQYKLLNISRSSLYYEPVINDRKEAIQAQIQTIFENIPIYGSIKVHQQLLEDGYKVSLNTVASYRHYYSYSGD